MLMFVEELTILWGAITLPVGVREMDVSQHLFIKFLLVRDLTAYNLILGRPTLNHVEAIIVTHIILMKFQCDEGQMITLYGNQQVPRECYLTTLKPSSWKVEEQDQTKAASEAK